MQELFDHRFERWDGWGPLGRAKGDQIPLPMRIVQLSVDAAFQHVLGGEERVVRPRIPRSRNWRPALTPVG